MNEQNINPWLSIWVRPRETIRYIIQKDANSHLWLLASFYGIVALLGLFQTFSLGYRIGLIPLIIAAIALAPFWGYAVFALCAWFLKVIGKWLGGQGEFGELRAAVAWSNVPIVFNILLWLIMLILFGSGLFQGFPGGSTMEPGILYALFAILLGQVVLSVWRLVIFINACSEVHQFSIWKSMLTIILGGIALGVISFSFLTIGFYLIGI